MDTFPEFFVSEKIYKIVRDVMKSYARESDIDLIVKDLYAKGAMSSDVLKKMAVVASRHMNSGKVSDMLLAIRTKLSTLIRYSIEPAKKVMPRNGNLNLMIMVENLAGALLKFKVGLSQMDRNNTSFIYNPVTNVTNNKLLKSQIIEPGQAKAFKFIIRSDIFSIQDLYELKKEGKISLTLGMQIVADSVDGLRSQIEKIPVEISKVTY